MRTAFLALIVASLFTPATLATAAPYAEYEPATGGITFVDLGTVDLFHLRTTQGTLGVANALGAPQITSDFGGQRITWGLPFQPTFFAGNVVTPGQPVDVLQFTYFHVPGDLRTGQIVTIPEPSTAALTALAFGFLLLRHRHSA